jgi:hypothetical protein
MGASVPIITMDAQMVLNLGVSTCSLVMFAYWVRCVRLLLKVPPPPNEFARDEAVFRAVFGVS